MLTYILPLRGEEEACHLIQQIPQESVPPLPSRGRHRALPLRSVMDACHRHASPETAVENGAGRVPPARSALSLPLEGRGETDSLQESAGFFDKLSGTVSLKPSRF